MTITATSSLARCPTSFTSALSGARLSKSHHLSPQGMLRSSPSLGECLQHHLSHLARTRGRSGRRMASRLSKRAVSAPHLMMMMDMQRVTRRRRRRMSKFRGLKRFRTQCPHPLSHPPSQRQRRPRSRGWLARNQPPGPSLRLRRQNPKSRASVNPSSCGKHPTEKRWVCGKNGLSQQKEWINLNAFLERTCGWSEPKSVCQRNEEENPS